MFGSRPEKNDPEIDKMNFWFTLIGPLPETFLVRMWGQIWILDLSSLRGPPSGTKKEFLNAYVARNVIRHIT